MTTIIRYKGAKGDIQTRPERQKFSEYFSFFSYSVRSLQETRETEGSTSIFNESCLRSHLKIISAISSTMWKLKTISCILNIKMHNIIH